MLVKIEEGRVIPKLCHKLGGCYNGHIRPQCTYDTTIPTLSATAPFLTKDHLDLLPPYPLLWKKKKKSISKAREKHRDCQKERSRLLCGGALQSDGQEIFATGIVTAQKTFIVDW